MNMMPTPPHTKRYRVFLSSTFMDNRKIRTLLIKKFKYARLFYTAMETFVGEVDSNLKSKLKEGIDASDIYILLVKYYDGTGTVSGNVEATRFEYQYAREKDKPIMAYLKDNGPYNHFGDNCTTDFKQNVSGHCKYSPLEDDPEAAATKIFCDILHHVSFDGVASYWIKSEFNQYDIAQKIFQKITTLNQSLCRTNSKIRWYKHKSNLPDHEKQDLIGRLVDAGVMKVEKNKAYRFLKPELRAENFSADDDPVYEMEYYVDRFDRYINGVIYDHKLNLYWYYVKDRSLSHTEASSFCPEISGARDDARVCRWKLPTIEALMSLMTEERQHHGFIDDIFDTHNVHWFWSATLAYGDEYALYIETIDKKIRAASIAATDVQKKAGFILCTKDKPFIEEPAIDHRDIDTPLPDISILQKLNGNTLYQLYFSQNLYDHLQGAVNSFEKHNYYVVCFSTIGARSSSVEQSIESEISVSDIYCVYILGNETDEVKKQIRLEVNLASNHFIPILLFKQTGHKIDLGEYGLADYDKHNVSTHISPTDQICSTILAAVHNVLPSVCGWIQKTHYDAIAAIISRINRIEEKMLIGEPHIRKYLENCNAMGLEDSLVKDRILILNANAGSCVRFVSKSNPVSMLLKNECKSKEAILLETFPDRFEKIDSDSGVYRDHYLNVHWNTNVVKQKTFDEAIAHANSSTNDKAHGWRLPKIEELMTLITPKFGSCGKYMDGDIFPEGRWFWSDTKADDGHYVYYINYHFFNNAIDLEKKSATEEFRKKSVLLICD